MVIFFVLIVTICYEEEEVVVVAIEEEVLPAIRISLSLSLSFILAPSFTQCTSENMILRLIGDSEDVFYR